MKLPRRRDANPERLVYGLMALLALIVIYLVAFVLSNTATVPVSFVLFDTNASLIWVMLICTLLGLIAGVAVSRLVTGRRGGRADGAGRPTDRPAASSRPTAAAGPAPARARADADTQPISDSQAPPGGVR